MQFDKELAERDKQLSGLRNQTLNELQKLGAHVQGDIEATRKLYAELEVKKSDKRDILELRQALQAGLDHKADLSDIQNVINKFTSDQTSKAFELRQELFKKLTEMQGLITAGVGNKVSLEEFNEALS